MDDKLPSVEIWDEVAQQYDIQIHDSEKQLASEIRKIIFDLGLTKGSKLIEVGSGSGHLSAVLAQAGYDVSLLDFSNVALEKSRELFDKLGIPGKFINGDLMDLNESDEGYDLVWNSGVMEHFDDESLQLAFQSLKKIKAKYYLFIVPNPCSFPYLLFRYKAMSKGEWIWGKEYLRDDYDNFLNNLGFQVIKKDYLGVSLSQEHIGYALGQEYGEFPLYSLASTGLILPEERYLKAYIACKESTFNRDDSTIRSTNKLAEYKTEIFDLNARVNQFKLLYNRVSKEITQLTKEKYELEGLLQKETSRIDKLNKDVEKKEHEITKLVEDVEKKEHEITKLVEDVEKKEHEITKLAGDVEKKEHEITKLVEDVEKKEHEIIKLTEDVGDRKYQIESQARMLNEKEEAINSYIQEVITTKRMFFDLRKKLTEFESQLIYIANTKPYRLAYFLRRLKFEFVKGINQEKKNFTKWITRKMFKKPTSPNYEYNPLFELASRMGDYGKIDAGSNVNIETERIVCQENRTNEKGFSFEYNFRKTRNEQYLLEPATEETRRIKDILKNRTYKGIVVYPRAVNWEPVQRPQHFLRELSKLGYLCFFAEDATTVFRVDEVETNLFVVNDERALLAAIKPYYVIVLCTWMLQTAFADLLDNKYVWYDILDKIDFFNFYDQDYRKKHEEMLTRSDLVTYSAHHLNSYVGKRKDAYLLPNASNLEDFINDENVDVPEDIKIVLSKRKKIIGYFGAIEEWFDYDLLNFLAKKNPECEFILIGHVGIDKCLFKQSNIHLLGKKNYLELSAYARHFDIAIIPFIVNDLTNCVSPVKFFEYCALGLPIISTNIYEMQKYKSDTVQVVSSKNEFHRVLEKFLNKQLKEKAQKNNLVIARENQWENRALYIEDIIQSNYNGLKVYSNKMHYDHIAAMAATFMDFNGTKFYAGGAERYLIDLHDLCKKMEIEFVIYQYGNYNWVRKYKDINIIAISPKNVSPEKGLSLEDVRDMNALFYHTNYSHALLNIYSAFFESWPMSNSPSVGISHGIAWDNPCSDFKDGYTFWNQNNRIIESAKICDRMVSVDTNTANWFQTINYEVGNKMTVIPNYVDLKVFKPRQDFDKIRDKVRIIYPRRLYEPRGLYLLLNIMDDILDKFENVEIHFIGRGFEEDTKYVVEKQNKWGNRVQWYSLLPEEMYTAYRDADISLVPTLYSEGTSLSCLEAMGSGNAIIATRIGGLTDLVINNYNGYLIEPTEEALKTAIISLLEDQQKLIRFKVRAVEVAKAFSKQLWNEKWKKVISEFVSEKSKISSTSKVVDIYIENISNRNDVIKNLMLPLLSYDILLYVRTRNNNNFNKKFSFGRLQFIDWNENLFTEPDIIIAEDYQHDSNMRIDAVYNEKFKLERDVLNKLGL